MNKLWMRLIGAECEHQQTLTVLSVGVKRTVCEDCGNVSFLIAPSLMVSHELGASHESVVEYPKVAGL